MAKTIMIQGTMSNAGKSLLAAGLCRIFKQDGYKVAPFKSQNMALNSFITEEGLEMGRAQVMQAEAAGIRPSVYMNPILLKPTNDTGSQVIVNGEVLGNMSARDYFAYKKNLIPAVLDAFHKLEEEYDIIVIEGAGSPAEINLKQDDIVNMGMAKMAKAPVLLVGDIDRGGVFAQLIGTVMLLEEDERAMVKGLIINKFRGDKTILDPGIVMLEEKAGIPVVGVAPYMQLEVEDEDSLTERFSGSQEVGVIDIAVIRIPRISNFTDFNPFESMDGVSLRYVHSVAELKNPDMIILPGTKNTMEDLLWMRQNGLEAAILKAAAAGTIIFGVCGGYQMLGETLSDPMGCEAGGELKGMGLLPMDTVFEEQKTRTRVKGIFGKVEGPLSGLSGTKLEGYEIHMGASTLKEGCHSMTKITDYARGEEQGREKEDGAYCKNVYGTYVHGIFDREKVAKAVVTDLGRRKGIDVSQITGVDFQAFKEQQYDILAAGLREHLNMKRIYEILEAGIGKDVSE
ncbi:MAG: cobyric acid synthase [Candidatus Limivivens sp.]|nr:cobyric acid synthase [Candidatus Limivivens sp.]